MELGLKGKVAMVTGGTSGIGRAICRSFATEGVNVAVLGRKEDKGNKVVAECKAQGADAIFVKTDVSRLEEVENAVKLTLGKFGRVDIMVHSAAPYIATGDYIKRFLDQPTKISEEFIGTILYGAIYCARAVLPAMIAKKSGRIINIGSDAGRVGDPFQPVYAAAKAGVVAFTKSIAQDVGARGILANVISPALTLTEEDEPMLVNNYGWGTEEGKQKLTRAYATRKLATAQDLADMVLFLASERAGDVTGQVIGVDGGYCMPSP